MTEQIRVYGQKSTKCHTCGKPIRRAKKFRQALWRGNKRPDGTPKTRQDIEQEIKIEVATWVKKPEWCVGCTRNPDPNKTLNL